MSITYEILGGPARDNALLVRIDSGQSIERLLFDCGEGCLDGISFGELQQVGRLFFSHLHMDHVAGFDSFFRANYGREKIANEIWGPPDTSRIMQHRFQGFLWNLHAEMTGTWRVVDIEADRLTTTRYELREAFAVAHVEETGVRGALIVEEPSFTIEALTMDHRTPTIAYVVREKPRRNFESERLASLGLKPGPWMKRVKDDAVSAAENVVIEGATHTLGALREKLVVETPGDSIAYLTDFLLNEAAIAPLAARLAGIGTILCEAQYRHADQELARKNYHMTTTWSAELARQAKAERLMLFHLSDRYARAEWPEMLAEARGRFSATEFPASWGI